MGRSGRFTKIFCRGCHVASEKRDLSDPPCFPKSAPQPPPMLTGVEFRLAARSSHGLKFHARLHPHDARTCLGPTILLGPVSQFVSLGRCVRLTMGLRDAETPILSSSDPYRYGVGLRPRQS